MGSLLAYGFSFGANHEQLYTTVSLQVQGEFGSCIFYFSCSVALHKDESISRPPVEELIEMEKWFSWDLFRAKKMNI